MAKYDAIISSAYRLISEYGRAVTINRESLSVNASEPWKPGAPTLTSYTTYGVRKDPLNSEKNFDFAIKVVPTTLTERVDWHIYIPAQGAAFEPSPGDSVVWGTDTYRVVTVSPVSPGEQDILYVLQVQV